MLQKAPERRKQFAVNLTFTGSARIAWREILHHVSALRHQRTLRILAPAYIGETDREGSGLFDPIRATDSCVTFYRLDEQLPPNQIEIEQLVESGTFDLLLVVHYFGFVNLDLSRIKNLCKLHDVTLVEDCAHCYLRLNLGTGSVGTEWGRVGDYSFYALHKFLPTSDGGVLRSNIESDAPFLLEESDRCSLDTLEQATRTDMAAVAEKRRSNYAFLQEAMDQLDGISSLWRLTDGTVPHNFPIYVPNGQRERLYFHLLSRDLPTIALYYHLVEEIDAALFPVSHAIANSILNLPVHQDTEERELHALVREIETFLET